MQRQLCNPISAGQRRKTQTKLVKLITHLRSRLRLRLRLGIPLLWPNIFITNKETNTKAQKANK